MNTLYTHIDEQQAAGAFTGQSAVFDELYGANTIINYKRERVRGHVLEYLKPGSSILELNCGTGEDAVYFAQKGFKVHATDLSAGMLNQAEQKVKKHQLNDLVNFERCSYTRLDQLKISGPYDYIFSNFAGLNCTGELDKVLESFPSLLNPGGIITLVILPEFCLWETLFLFKGKFRTAFRRFFSANGRDAKIGDNHFKCWYYNPSYITRRLKDSFDVLNIEGLCTIVPPSYIEGFAEKHPKLFRSQVKWENRLKTTWPWKYIGDYYIISFRKKV